MPNRRYSISLWVDRIVQGDMGIGVGGAVNWLTSGLGVCSRWDGWRGFSFASQVVVMGVSIVVI